jgi:hypothetical protein
MTHGWKGWARIPSLGIFHWRSLAPISRFLFRRFHMQLEKTAKIPVYRI